MIITISGTPGSGKSTLGRLIAQKYGYEFLSMGNIRREYAKSKGMTLEELNQKAVEDTASDKLVDEHLKELAKKDNLVIDSRLAYFFIPQSFKIFVDADKRVRASRIHSHVREEESYADVEAMMQRNEARAKEDKARYNILYGIKDYEDKKNFDLVLDSSKKTPEQLFFIVDKAINLKKQQPTLT